MFTAHWRSHGVDFEADADTLDEATDFLVGGSLRDELWAVRVTDAEGRTVLTEAELEELCYPGVRR